MVSEGDNSVAFFPYLERLDYFVDVVGFQDNGVWYEATYKIPTDWSGDLGRLREVDHMV